MSIAGFAESRSKSGPWGRSKVVGRSVARVGDNDNAQSDADSIESWSGQGSGSMFAGVGVGPGLGLPHAGSASVQLRRIRAKVTFKSLWSPSAKPFMLPSCIQRRSGFNKFRGLRVLGMFRIDPFQSHRSGELRSSLLESLVNGARPMSAAVHSR